MTKHQFFPVPRTQYLYPDIFMIKIDPATIAFDVDDVFADTMSLFLDIARNEHHLEELQREDITSYMVEDCIDVDVKILADIFTKILDGSHAAELKPVKGAVEVLTRLGRNYSPIIFVTARNSLNSIVDWIHRVLPLDPALIEVIATGSFDGKVEVLLNKGISFFVEDRLETCFLLMEAGVTPILFKRPWNRREHPFVEVGSWDELEALMV